MTAHSSVDFCLILRVEMLNKTSRQTKNAELCHWVKVLTFFFLKRKMYKDRCVHLMI